MNSLPGMSRRRSKRAGRGVSDVIARCLLSEAIRLFREGRPIEDVAAELNAAAENLDEDEPLAFMRP